MKTTIYYYSGSGNSLALAKRLSEELGETQTVPMAGFDYEENRAPEERIGMIFPVYAYGMPATVERFFSRFNIGSARYVFAVVSTFGIPGSTLKKTDRILRKNGHRIDAGFAVLDPRSSLAEDPRKDPVQRMMISLNRGQCPRPSIERMPEIVDCVNQCAKHTPETSNMATNFFGSLMHRLAKKGFQSIDENFWTTDACNGCGTCARICPRGNIKISNGKPVWNGECDYCHACIQWCGKTAIQFRDITEQKRRYTNPKIQVNEMLLR